jgi:magnesium transporter
VLIYKICQDSLVESNFNEFKAENENKYWFIMTPEELDKNNGSFQFNYQTIYDCIHNEDAPKLEVYENFSFGILNIITPIDNFFTATELNFYISKNFLIFVSKKNLDIFTEIKNDITNKGNLRISLEKILYSLIDKMTNKDYNMLTNLESEISDVEEEVLECKIKDYAKDIVILKNKLLFLKRHYEPLLDIIENLIENENKVVEDNSITYFTILSNRIERLNRKVGNLRDYVTQIRESYQAQLDINLNNTMKLFTVITAVFSPLTLIVGWYGMNFSSMPEYHWKYGYIYVILFSAAVLFCCLWIFKKRKLW